MFVTYRCVSLLTANDGVSKRPIDPEGPARHKGGRHLITSYPDGPLDKLGEISRPWQKPTPKRPTWMKKRFPL